MLKSMKVALWQLKSWKGSLRVLIVMLLAVMFTIYKSSSYIDYLKSVDGIINIFETYVIVSSNGWHHALMFMLALVLFADAPFMDNNSLYVVCRIGRYKWCLGKILYIIIASIIFNAVIMLTTIAVSVAYSYGGNIWSESFLRVLDGEVLGCGYDVFFENNEIAYELPPMQTAFVAAGLGVLLNSMMGTMLFVLNSVNGKVLGFSVTGIMYFAGFAISGMDIAKFLPLDNSMLGYQNGTNDLKFAVIYLGGITLLMIIASFLCIRKVDYKITTGDRV